MPPTNHSNSTHVIVQNPSYQYNNPGYVMGSSGSSSSSLQQMINSGVPITGGNSASYVDQNAAGLEPLQNITANFDRLFDLIQKNTQYNNAWSAEQAQKQMDFQTQSNQIAMDFNAAEAAKNRDWQQMMSNTAHQREIADLRAAGLNPVLSVTGGNGAPVTSGSAASGVTSGGAMADADQSGNTALASIYGALINAQTSMYNANLSARTNLAMAEISKEAAIAGASLAANASMYGADTSYRNSEAQREWNAAHPQTVPQAVTDVANALFGDPGANNGTGKSAIQKAADWIRTMHYARKNS